MEETLGKRIVANRKRVGMTQDQLAEQLGVTAQAVSKWENDQSCPDINMIPKLSQIFGISTDELLGNETASRTYEAEVVHTEEEEPEGVHLQHGNWEFKWDSGRKDSLMSAIYVLLVGVLTLLSKVLSWDVSFWEILWPSALLIIGLRGLLYKFSFFRMGCTLFGGYFLLSNLNLVDLKIGNDMIFPVLIVIFGLSLLVDALHKPKKPRFRVVHNGGNSKKTKSEYEEDGEEFSYSLSFGEASRTVTLPRLSSGEACVSFGELVVDLTECEEIADGCEIDCSCSFGELVLKVPADYRVQQNADTAFGNISVSGHPVSEPKGTIYLDGNVSFGEITVRYQ